MIKIGKITIRTKEDFSSLRTYNSYKWSVRFLIKPLVLSASLYLFGLFVCYFNVINSAFAFIVVHNPFIGIVSIAIALYVLYYIIYEHRELKQSLDEFSHYERIVYDIIRDVELDTQLDTQLEIPFEEYK